jgi:hypothetical protein
MSHYKAIKMSQSIPLKLCKANPFSYTNPPLAKMIRIVPLNKKIRKIS